MKIKQRISDLTEIKKKRDKRGRAKQNQREQRKKNEIKDKRREKKMNSNIDKKGK